MQTEAEIARRMSREYLVSHLPMMFFVGAAIAFYWDGSWERGAAAGFAASICIVIGGVRRLMLARELRLSRLNLSD